MKLEKPRATAFKQDEARLSSKLDESADLIKSVYDAMAYQQDIMYQMPQDMCQAALLEMGYALEAT